MITLTETERTLNLLTFRRRKLVSLLKSNRRKEDEAKQDYLRETGWLVGERRGWIEPPPFTSRVQWGLTHAYNIQKEIEAGTWRATQNTTS